VVAAGMGTGGRRCGNGQRAVAAAEVGVPLTSPPPLGVHVLMCRVKLDVGEVDLADVLRSSWIGTVKLLD
jgi:hypothetical protein